MVQLDTKAGCVMCYSDDHKSTLSSGQIRDVKYPKWKKKIDKLCNYVITCLKAHWMRKDYVLKHLS